MIYYNLNTINDWNFGDDNIIKVYKHGAVCYYKITSGDTPTPVQEPCFAVVDDITQYSDTEFEDVFNKADGKWYKLNNLNQYEQYGVYGSGRTITTYEGKLTIDTESTPQPSRLPAGYTEVEYIENTGTTSSNGAYINSGLKLYDVVGNSFSLSGRVKSEYYSASSYDDLETILNSEDVSSPYYGFTYRYAHSTHVIELSCTPSNSVTLSSTANTDGSNNILINCASTTVTTQVPLGLFASYKGNYNTPYRFAKATIYFLTVVKNGVTVRDFVPAKRDSDDKYGLYDLITDTFYTSPNGNNFSGGSEVIPPPITTTYEYIYSGGSWVNLGEVSGSTQIIKSPEYIEKDSSHSGKIDLNYVWKTNTKMQFKFYSTNNGGNIMIGEDGMPDNNDCRVFFASTNAYFDYGSGRITWSSNGRTNTLYEYEYGNYYIKNMVTSASKTGSTFSVNRTNPLYLGLGGSDRFRTYYLKFYDGDTLVKDFIPWTDMNGNYGLFDKVSLSVYNVSSGSLTGSSNVTDVEVGGGYEYPLEYPVIQDPPDNLVFSSMTEAESYECPWVGMHATINGDKYVFSGDSQSGYEWVNQPSRLPSGYTEVEYVENTSTAYIDTGAYLNTSNFEVGYTFWGNRAQWGYVHQNVGSGAWVTTANDYAYMGRFDSSYRVAIGSYLTSDENTLVYTQSGVTVNGTSISKNLNLSGTDNLNASTLLFFAWYDFYRAGVEHSFNSKVKSFYLKNNGTLVRDFVPAKRDSDSKYGMYDLVTNTFYLSLNNVDFSGGDPI